MQPLASFLLEFHHPTYLWVFFSHLQSPFIFLHPAIQSCLSLCSLSTSPCGLLYPCLLLKLWYNICTQSVCVCVQVRACVHMSCVHVCARMRMYQEEAHQSPLSWGIHSGQLQSFHQIDSHARGFRIIRSLPESRHFLQILTDSSVRPSLTY